MKKFLLAVSVLLTLTLLGGCSKPQEERPVISEPTISPAEPATTPTVETDSESSTTHPLAEPDSELSITPPLAEPEGDALPDSGDVIYTQQIERYDAAISEQWDESAYFDHEMSPLAAYYYEGNALDHVGFTLMDLDGDDIQELIIGAIKNAEHDPLVFEIWTTKNGEPVMLAQSGSRNRYYMQYSEEDGVWSVAYEAENGAANHAVYYLHLAEGEFEVTQGVVFDAVANENEPWFMAYDLDWDVSNDMPIDEDTANAVMDAERNLYTALEYLPYSLYK